jgi:phosphoglycerate dehydrogenase-like enzyme
MTDKKKILIALTPREKETFFPKNYSDLLDLAAEYKEVDPLAYNAQTWAELLLTYQPEILVSGWKAPTLPVSIIGNPDNKLKYLVYLPGSVRKILPIEFLDAGLLVTNWGNVISRVVAECGLLLALAALRRVGYWAPAMQRDGAWKNEQTVTGSLFERKVGLHGFGSISQELVRLMKPFGVEIATYSPSVPDSLLAEFGVSRAKTLEDLFSQYDVIIELAALTPKNVHMVTEELIRMIPEGGAFVNIGRGAVVDEYALARVASEGKIQVAVDVYEVEPLPKDHPFRNNPNIILLPHLGGPTTDRRADCGKLGIQNIKNYYEGKPLENLITRSIYERAT